MAFDAVLIFVFCPSPSESDGWRTCDLQNRTGKVAVLSKLRHPFGHRQIKYGQGKNREGEPGGPPFVAFWFLHGGIPVEPPMLRAACAACLKLGTGFQFLQVRWSCPPFRDFSMLHLVYTIIFMRGK
jgi:hypothetical protein